VLPNSALNFAEVLRVSELIPFLVVYFTTLSVSILYTEVPNGGMTDV
jgi:hypothetical protein